MDLKTETLPYIESAQIAEKYKSSYLHNGDVIVADTAEDEAAGKCTEMLGLGDVPAISGLHTIPLRPQYEFATGYLGYYLNSDAYHDTLLPLLQGTKVLSISKTALQGTSICYPNDYQEQAQIGDCFRKLDKLIILQQRKYEKLVALKAACLDKMFPKNGSKVPEVRFAGFAGEWEPRKFSDLAEIRRGLTYSPANIREKGIRVLRSSNIAEDQFVYGDEDVFVEASAVNIPCANKGDILITSANGSTRLVGKHAIIREIPDETAVHGGFMLLATAKNPEFLNAFMSAPWYAKFITLFVAGGNGAIGNLNKTDLDEQDVVAPTDTEQEQIGELFKNLDKLITLQQHKIEKLKQLKQSMLHNMFV